MFFTFPLSVLAKGSVASLLDNFAVFSTTLAFMSDSSGFVSLIGFIQVVYAFLVDTFIFGVSFTATQLISAIVIMTVMVVVVYLKLDLNRRTQAQL